MKKLGKITKVSTTEKLKLKQVSTGNHGGSKKLPGLIGSVTKIALDTSAHKPLKQVSTGNAWKAKKLTSKVTSSKKNKGEPAVKVGVAAPALLAKGMKAPKGFRSPFNQK